MYTRCPDCKTYFRVTAENLRVANGEVCCGACETEFNALASLADEVPDELIDDNGRDAIPDELVDNDYRGETDIGEPVSEDESEIYGEIIVLESEQMMRTRKLHMTIMRTAIPNTTTPQKT